MWAEPWATWPAEWHPCCGTRWFLSSLPSQIIQWVYDSVWMPVCFKGHSWGCHRAKKDPVKTCKMCSLPFTTTFPTEVIFWVWIKRWQCWIFSIPCKANTHPQRWTVWVCDTDRGEQLHFFWYFTTCCHQLPSPSFKNCSKPAEVQHSLNESRECLICSAMTVPLYF